MLLLAVILFVGCGKEDPKTAALRRAEAGQEQFEHANREAEKRMAEAQARAEKQQAADQKRSEELLKKSQRSVEDRTAREIEQRESEAPASSQPSN